MHNIVFDPNWLIAAFVLFLGCTLQTALGFGMAVFAAPVIVFYQPNWVPFVLTSTALILSFINAVDLRAHVRSKELFPAFISRIPGTVVGAYLLVVINLVWFQIIVAASVLIAVAVSISAIHFKASPTRLAWAGFFSGLMGTSTSIGGPPMALAMQFDSPNKVRANLSVYFTYSCVLSLISYAVAGLLTTHIIYLCLSFVPVAGLGFVTGRRLQKGVSRTGFRPLLLGLCGASACVAIAGVLWKL